MLSEAKDLLSHWSERAFASDAAFAQDDMTDPHFDLAHYSYPSFARVYG